MIDKIIPFLIAAGIGFAIGVERERRYANTVKSMGVRTFTLLALLGALAGFVKDPWIAVSITLISGALIVAGYIQTTRKLTPEHPDLGLTSEFAAALTFVASYIAGVEPFISALIGLSTLIVLLSRERLHEFTLKKIRPEEIQAAVLLFVLGIGVLPLLPSEPVDPWGILNLNRFVMLMVLVGSVQFLGYLLTRFLGSVVGFPVTGFISGLVSSTAVFLTMPLQVKENPRMANAAAAAAIFAAVSTFLFLMLVVGAISLPVLMKVAPPLLASVAIGTLAALFLARQKSEGQEFPEPKNPLSLLSALKLAAILSGFTIVIGVVQRFIGDIGAEVTSFLAGLGELHGVSIASASLYANGKIESIGLAQSNILLAALASMVSKIFITWVLIRDRYAILVSAILVLMLAGFILTWVFV